MLRATKVQLREVGLKKGSIVEVVRPGRKTRRGVVARRGRGGATFDVRLDVAGQRKARAPGATAPDKQQAAAHPSQGKPDKRQMKKTTAGHQQAQQGSRPRAPAAEPGGGKHKEPKVLRELPKEQVRGTGPDAFVQVSHATSSPRHRHAIPRH